MESIITQSVENGEQQKTCMEVVSHVLPKNSTFLENIGYKISSGEKTRIGVSSQVQDLQSELENERKESAGLRQEVDVLTSQANESEMQLVKQSQEIDSLKKSSAETNAFFVFFTVSYS
jgi:chromosome segregation ATPase